MLSKKELFNAKSSANKIEAGLTIDVVNTGEYTDTDKDGNPVTVTVMVSKTGEVYSSISKTIHDSQDLLDDCIADSEEGFVTVEIIESKSNSGRNFYQLRML